MTEKLERKYSKAELEMAQQMKIELMTQLHSFAIFMDKFKTPIRKQYVSLPTEESDGTFLGKLKYAFFEICKYVYAVSDTIKKSTEVITRLKNEDLFLMPFIIETLPVQEMYDLFNQPELKAIEIYGRYFEDRANLDALFESWMAKNTEFAKRREILKDCIEAHANKKYTLSIPVLLAQIDGIVCAAKKHDKAQRLLDQKRKKMYKDLDHMGETNLIDRMISMFDSHSGAEKWERPYPNRHYVLHGRDIEYYNKPHYSMLLIVILDYLAEYSKVGEKDNGTS